MAIRNKAVKTDMDEMHEVLAMTIKTAWYPDLFNVKATTEYTNCGKAKFVKIVIEGQLQ